MGVTRKFVATCDLVKSAKCQLSTEDPAVYATWINMAVNFTGPDQQWSDTWKKLSVCVECATEVFGAFTAIDAIKPVPVAPVDPVPVEPVIGV